MGSAIAARSVPKILLLNGSTDRETRAVGMEFGALDFVRAIADACDSSRGKRGACSDYVTHVIHLHGEGTPRVEKEELAKLGVECVRIYGRKVEVEGGGVLYDGMALAQALEAILGRREGRGDKVRRNTLETLLYSPKKVPP